MTDPKELADKIRKKGFRMPEDVQPTLEALDSYARILAASPDVREIERTHAEVDYDQGLSGSEANEAHRNRATLLDVVRRKDAEIQELRKANESFIGETWKTERELIHAANRERDQARKAHDDLEAEVQSLHDRHYKQQRILRGLIDAHKMPVKLGHSCHAETVAAYIEHLAPSVAGQQKRADALADQVATSHAETARLREELRLLRLDVDTSAHVERFLPNGELRNPPGGAGTGRS